MSAVTLQPQWWHDAVVYQIYPRSFNDANGDGIGDLQGIIQKLDHIKALGTEVIWLSPVYKSPMDDNGYDISDYCDIAPEFGTMADMEQLLDEAKQRGIRIVMDLVVNHTSDEHSWFVESRSSRDNPKRDWYIWRDPKADGSEPNNWESFFCPKAWKLDETTGQYYLHLFSEKQPDLNWANSEVREAVFEMMHFWLQKGLGGFRMDVINMIGKPSDLPDAALFGEGVAGWEHWANNSLCHQYLREMNQKVLSHYDVMTVGEATFTTPLDGQLFSHPDRHELSMIFHFEHMSIDRNENEAESKPFDLVQFKQIMAKWQDGVYQSGWNSLYWNNHDQARAISRFGNDSPQYRVLSGKMLATVLHIMSGTPYIYQGEEIGMINKRFESIDEINDIMGKFHYQKMHERGIPAAQAMAYLNRFSRDHARLPVQWNSGQQAGFTTGEPWLALNDNYETINVEEAVADPNSLFHYYRKLIELRKQSVYREVIIYGKHQLLDADDSEVYAFLREYQGKQLLVVANFTGQTLNRNYDYGCQRTVMNNYSSVEPESKPVSFDTLTLQPYQAYVFEVTAR